MASVPQAFAHINRQKRASHTAHRKAFGPGKHRTPEQRAADVAASIAQRTDHGDAWDWSTYGLDGPDRWAQRRLVEAALAQLDGSAGDETRLQAHFYEEECALREAQEERTPNSMTFDAWMRQAPAGE